MLSDKVINVGLNMGTLTGLKGCPISETHASLAGGGYRE